MSIVAAIIALGFLIFFHELGHFLAAKAMGVGVLEFSIGMGPRLISKVVGNTRYSLKLLPFGGSCAMLGEDPAGSGDFTYYQEYEEEREAESVAVRAGKGGSRARSSERQEPSFPIEEPIRPAGGSPARNSERREPPLTKEPIRPAGGSPVRNSERREPPLTEEPIRPAGGSPVQNPESQESPLAEDEDFEIDYDGVVYLRSEIDQYSYEKKPAWKRFIICIAGVANNFLLAFLLAMLVIGISGFDKPVIMGTTEGAPAAQAGFQRGDMLVSVSYNGRHLRKVHCFRELYIWLYIHSGEFQEDGSVEAVFRRQGELMKTAFSPFYDEERQEYRLGISFFSGHVLPRGVLELVQDAFYEVRYNVLVVFDSFYLISKGRVHRNEVMGPVGTVSVISETVEESREYGLLNAFLVLMELTIMLSANLGVMNLLPVPALDGGRLLFILLEMLLRRRLDPKLEGRINTVGMILLLVLMVLILSNDIYNLATGAYRNLGGM